MDAIKTPIYATTFLLFTLALAPFFGVPDVAIIVVTALSPLVVIWMVVRVLKDGTAPTQHFSDQFYEDYAAKRITERAVNEEAL